MSGFAVGEMQAKMMEKIEELTLYVIQLQKRLDTQSAEIEELRTQVYKSRHPAALNDSSRTRKFVLCMYHKL